MSTMRLTGLFRYPVKSVSGEALERMVVGPRGPWRDRHWMLVDPDGSFLTQRQQPKMALISARLAADESLILTAPGMPELHVQAGEGPRGKVRVWSDQVIAASAGESADAWLSGFLAIPCRLVCLPEDIRRPVDPAYATLGEQVGFADGFPFLLISQGSLDGLNARLSSPVPMRRFRPNLVVDGCAPHAEDGWRRIRIGDLVLRVVKPCSRCGIPGIDPATAKRGPEPMRTLMTYRRQGPQVFFGQNLLHDGCSVLELGMPVEVLE